MLKGQKLKLRKRANGGNGNGNNLVGPIFVANNAGGGIGEGSAMSAMSGAASEVRNNNNGGKMINMSEMFFGSADSSYQ